MELPRTRPFPMSLARTWTETYRYLYLLLNNALIDIQIIRQTCNWNHTPRRAEKVSELMVGVNLRA